MNSHVFSIMVENLRTSAQFTRTFFGHRVHSTGLICWRLKEDRERLKMVDIELCKTATWIMQCYCGPILAVSLVYSERYSLTLLFRSALLLSSLALQSLPLTILARDSSDFSNGWKECWKAASFFFSCSENPCIICNITYNTWVLIWQKVNQDASS